MDDRTVERDYAVGAVEPTAVPVSEVATTARWEVYGHWTEDETRLRTDVFYLVEPKSSGSR